MHWQPSALALLLPHCALTFCLCLILLNPLIRLTLNAERLNIKVSGELRAVSSFIGLLLILSLPPSSKLIRAVCSICCHLVHPLQLASMSLAGAGSNDNACGERNSDALHKAICQSTKAGILFVAAAGQQTASSER
jgi:hypothetical protein